MIALLARLFGRRARDPKASLPLDRAFRRVFGEHVHTWPRRTFPSGGRYVEYRCSACRAWRGSDTLSGEIVDVLPEEAVRG